LAETKTRGARQIVLMRSNFFGEAPWKDLTPRDKEVFNGFAQEEEIYKS
jgi:hypothetical protein